MIELVITGGQTGADQAGWRAAKNAGIRTSGYMPRGFKTEAGPRPEFADLYGAREHPAADYPARRRANLDLTAMIGGEQHGLAVVFDATPKNKGMSPGTKGLFNDFNELMGRGDRCPWVLLVRIAPSPGGYRVTAGSHNPEGLAWAIDHCEARALMVAGNRESSAPGIGAWVEEYMRAVFEILKANGGRDD